MDCKPRRSFEDRVADETSRVYYDVCPLNRKERRTVKGKLKVKEAEIAALKHEIALLKERDLYDPTI